MFIYLVVLIVIILWGAKLSSKGKVYEDFLSLKSCKRIQGICAVSIVLHHLVQNVVQSKGDPGVMVLFLHAGYLLVSIFFFCSGYGLYVSYKNKSNYLNGFIKKRLPAVILPLFIINTICTIIVLVSGDRFYTDLNPISAGLDAFIYKITTFLGITLMYSDAWYVIAISLFYIAFYLIFKNCKKENTAIAIMGVVTVLYAIIGMCLPPIGFFWDEGEWWYNSSFIFFIGILVGKNEKTIIEFVKNKYKILLPISFLGVIVIWNVAIGFDTIGGVYGRGIAGVIGALIAYVCKTLAEILFVVFIFLLAMKVRCNNIIIRFLSNISYEIYLTHGVFLSLLRSKTIYIDNSIVFFALVIVCSMIASIILKRIDSTLIEAFKNKVTTKSTKKPEMNI